MSLRLVCPCGHSSFRHGYQATLGRLAKSLFGRSRRDGCQIDGCPCKLTNPHQATS